MTLQLESTFVWTAPPVPSNTQTLGVSVVVPIHNEQEMVLQTIELLHGALRQAKRPYEIIVVDDGSTDESSAALSRAANIKHLHHEQNRGYGASLKTGIKQATYPLIAIVDGDGTYPIDRLPYMLDLADNADMVVGARTGRNVHQPWLRRLPKWVLRRFAEWLTHSEIPDLNSGMRVFRKEQAERVVHLLPDGFSFTSTITMALLVRRRRVEFVSIDYHKRVGRSKIRPIHDTIKFFQLIIRTAFLFAPLRVFLPIAGVFFLLFLISLVWDISCGDLTDRSLLLLTGATQLGMFSMLTDLIHKRSMAN